MILALLTWVSLAEPPDRSVVPDVVPAAPLEQPEMVRSAPRPGLEVVLVPTPGMRKTRISLMFRRGSRQLAPDGTASMDAFGWIWDQASARFDGDALAVYEDVHDVDVWSTSSFETTTVHLDAPLTSLEPGLELLRDVVVNPRFQRKDWRMVTDNRYRWFTLEAPTEGGALIEGGLDHLWVPEGHLLDPRPDVSGWLNMRFREMRELHAELLDTAPLTLVVVGDFDMETVREKIMPVAEGLGVPDTATGAVPFEAPKGTRVLGIDLYGTGRASIGVRLPAPAAHTPDSRPFRLIDHAMGGHFLARLNKDLRETRGLTYGIDSSYSASRSLGTWTLSTEVSVEDAEEAIGAIRQQLDDLAADGLTEVEVGDGVRARVSAWNSTFSTVERAARVYSSRIRFGRSMADSRATLDDYAAISVDDTRQVSARWLDGAPRAWVIVGERSELDPQLERLGMEVEWLPGELVILGRGVGPEPE